MCFILEYGQDIKIIKRVLEVIGVVTFLVGVVIQPIFWVSAIAFILLLLCQMIISLPKILLSLRGFLSIGIVYWFIINILISVLLVFVLRNVTAVYLIGIYFLPAITWIFYSLLANNKVAKIANFLFSSMYALLALFKDMFLATLPSIPPFKISEVPEILKVLEIYPYTQIIEMVLNAVLMPVLITNITAMVLCELKGYWIEKYNNDQDVGDL